MNNSNIIEIPVKDFKKLLDELNRCRDEKTKLLDAVDFLNSQIQEYNEKFTKNGEKNDK